jgi:photosystem II stability/assembly factor-like uncharacterized protein
MKNRIALGLTFLILVLAALSCNLPWEQEPTPVGAIETKVSETPTEKEAETETATSTVMITPSLTPTEEISVPLPIFPSPVILEFEMFTPSHGWALTQDNDRLLRTVDGGQTWLDATPADLHPLPAGLTTLGLQPFFLDESIAWFTPNSVGSELYHTRDGGVSWTVNAIPFERARYFFLDANLGYALVDLGAAAGSHYVAIYRTADSGATWVEIFTHEPGKSKSLREGGSKGGITFLDVNHGWIGGNIPMEDHFYLYYSSDGGATWAQETDISLPGLYAGSFLDVRQPFFINNIVGYLPVRAMALDSTMHLLVYRSDDSGQTWAFHNAVQDGRDMDFYSVDGGWIAAGAKLLQTVDGGANWTPVTGAGIPPGEAILEVDFVDDQHGWVIVTPDESTLIPLKLYTTTDGGAHWSQVLPLTSRFQ